MNAALAALVCSILGFALLVTGCALISDALALIVAGAGLLTLGFVIDVPRRRA